MVMSSGAQQTKKYKQVVKMRNCSATTQARKSKVIQSLLLTLSRRSPMNPQGVVVDSAEDLVQGSCSRSEKLQRKQRKTLLQRPLRMKRIQRKLREDSVQAFYARDER